jgi:hypothetical protein
MDLDSNILSLIDGYVSSALGATGTKKPAPIHKPVEAFEDDTIPDVMSLLPLPMTQHEDFDESTTSVHQQRLIKKTMSRIGSGTPSSHASA